MVARVDSYRKQNITRSNSNPDPTIRDNFLHIGVSVTSSKKQNHVDFVFSRNVHGLNFVLKLRK